MSHPTRALTTPDDSGIAAHAQCAMTLQGIRVVPLVQVGAWIALAMGINQRHLGPGRKEGGEYGARKGDH